MTSPTWGRSPRCGSPAGDELAPNGGGGDRGDVVASGQWREAQFRYPDHDPRVQLIPDGGGLVRIFG